MFNDRKCQHGVNVGPLDDHGITEHETVKSSYCVECNPRIVQREDGTYTYTIDWQYLTEEEKRKVSGDPPSAK